MAFKTKAKWLTIALAALSLFIGCDDSDRIEVLETTTNSPHFRFDNDEIQGSVGEVLFVTGEQYANRENTTKCDYGNTRMGIALIGEHAETYLASLDQFKCQEWVVDGVMEIWQNLENGETLQLEVWYQNPLDWVGSYEEGLVNGILIITNSSRLLNERLPGIRNGCLPEFELGGHWIVGEGTESILVAKDLETDLEYTGEVAIRKVLESGYVVRSEGECLLVEFHDWHGELYPKLRIWFTIPL